jgi:hypothetical protein
VASAKPPFDILRACFWLLACIIAVILLIMMLAAISCAVGVLVTKVAEPGTCVKLGLPDLMHDWWSEILTAVLALIAAGGRMGPPPSPPPDQPEKPTR